MDKIKNNVTLAWRSIYRDLEKKLPGHAIHAWFDPIVAVDFQKNLLFWGAKPVFFRMD